VSQEVGIDKAEDINPEIAGAFAGGIGNTGSVCGAVIGAVMAIGLKLGKKDTMEESLRNLTVARAFRRRFEEEAGSINCRDLTGLDLTTDEGIKQLMKADIPRKVCFPAVGTAFRIAVDLLKEES
jgi:C_GCAxxG_C_C family probable redox protein